MQEDLHGAPILIDYGDCHEAVGLKRIAMKARIVASMFSGTRCGDVDGEIPQKGRLRFDPVVLVCILVLAVLLGVLNNLRVADDCKVKWFDAPADRSNHEMATEAAP